MALPVYTTGTVSVNAGGTTVTLAGGDWNSPNARQGDFISIDGLDAVLVTEVTDALHLKIPPWQAANKSGVSYTIYQNYVARVVGVAAAEQVGELVAALQADGFVWFVKPGATAPDPSYGKDGQWAYQPSTGKWWQKLSGVWTASSAPVAGYGGTSTTSLAIGTGSKVFTTQPGLAYDGARVHAASHADPSKWMEGVVSYAGTTLTMTADKTGGAGTVNDWVLSLAGQPGINGVGYGGTSTTSLAIGTGSKVFTTQAGLGYNGARVRATSAADLSKWLEGPCSYSGTTLTMTADKTGGAGSAADWVLSIAGQPGTNGTNGTNGINGTNGVGYGGSSTTSLAIGVGSKVFTTQVGLGYNGARVRATSAADVSKWLEGPCSYSGTTLTMTADKFGGAGSVNDWVFSIAGLPGADGASGDADRQNDLLTRIYQSKLFAGYRRFINAFADGYKASDGIAAISSSNYTVDASGGKVSPALTTPVDQIPTMSAATTSGVTVSAASSFSGLNAWSAADDNNATFWGSNGGFSNMWWKVDFGSSKVIGSYTIRSRTDNNGFYPTAWKLQGSADDSAWTDLDNRSGQSFSAGGTQLSFSVASPAAYRYYRLLISAGLDATYVQFAEVELKDAAISGNMTLVTTAQQADATIGKARVLLEYDNVGNPTINTDLTVEVTCNGGANWHAATLAAISSKGQNSRYIAESGEVTCTAGTSFAARIKTFNNKNIPIHGLSLTVSA